MDKERKDQSFIKKPVFPGGPKAMKEFVSKNLKYPVEAAKVGFEGNVRLKYEINYKGEVMKVKVVTPIGYGCDEEAVRVVKLFKFQVPKNPRKLKVKFSRTITIHFRKPKKKTKSVIQLNYQLKTNKSSDTGSKSYSYTITT